MNVDAVDEQSGEISSVTNDSQPFCFAATSHPEVRVWASPPPHDPEVRAWASPPPQDDDRDWTDEECRQYEGEWWQPPPIETSSSSTSRASGVWASPPPDTSALHASLMEVSRIPIPESCSDDDELCEEFQGLVASLCSGRSCKILVDSGSVVNTCSEDFDPSTTTAPGKHWNLEALNGHTLAHHGYKPGMNLATNDDIPMKIDFEVTNTKRPILSVKKGAEH